MMNIDESIFYAFYNLSGHSRVGDFFIVFFGDYFIFIAILVFAYVAYRAWRKGGIPGAQLYVLATFATVVAEGFSVVIKFLSHRTRPFVEMKLPHLLTDNSYAFPSGHTTFLFALATATYFFNKKLAYFLYATGIVVGLSRIAGGVHYPSDIFGGAVIGACTGFVMYKLWERYIAHFIQQKWLIKNN